MSWGVSKSRCNYAGALTSAVPTYNLHRLTCILLSARAFSNHSKAALSRSMKASSRSCALCDSSALWRYKTSTCEVMQYECTSASVLSHKRRRWHTQRVFRLQLSKAALGCIVAVCSFLCCAISVHYPLHSCAHCYFQAARLSESPPLRCALPPDFCSGSF